MATVQLKKLNQQDAQVLAGVPGIDARMKLRKGAYCKCCLRCQIILIHLEYKLASYLQEADDHEDEGVGAYSACEDFIQVSLQQELLQHKDQVRQHRVLLKVDRGIHECWEYVLIVTVVNRLGKI